MTEETADKKRRTREEILDAQIRKLEEKRGTEVGRLIAREQARLAEKALNKRDFGAAVTFFRAGLSAAEKLMPPPAQQDLPDEYPEENAAVAP